MIKKTFYELKKIAMYFLYRLIDPIYLKFDKKKMMRTRNIRLIPRLQHREGGRISYAEWGHVIGIFQTLIFQNITKTEGVQILDIGCGKGIMGIASEPFLFNGGHYIGIDVMEDRIKYCKKNFDSQYFSFFLINSDNPFYNRLNGVTRRKWDFEKNSFDLVTALSVWTHFDQEDAVFYLKEVERVLKPGGKAIITFFLLNELYKKKCDQKDYKKSNYHLTSPAQWTFERSVKGSKYWFCPEWARIPEAAIGITSRGMEKLSLESGLKIEAIRDGSWKDIPGIYFQDIVIFKKISENN